MMPDTIRLLNPFLAKNRISVLYFYDGRAPIEGGVVSIPADKPHWVQRALIMGFNKNPDGSPYRREATPQPATVEVERVEDSVENAGEPSDEGTDGGGQPTGDDGVRTSEPEGSDSTPDEGDGTGDSDSPADAGSGDGTSA